VLVSNSKPSGRGGCTRHCSATPAMCGSTSTSSPTLYTLRKLRYASSVGAGTFFEIVHGLKEPKSSKIFFTAPTWFLHPSHRWSSECISLSPTISRTWRMRPICSHVPPKTSANSSLLPPTAIAHKSLTASATHNRSLSAARSFTEEPLHASTLSAHFSNFDVRSSSSGLE